MAAIAYPSTLPAPQQLPITPAERRLVSELDGVRIAAVHQRDWAAVQSVGFTFSSAEMAIFRAWWRDDLTLGGAWFSADWPQPQGGSGVRRFIGTYRREFIVGYGWRVSAMTELRGLGISPTAAPAPPTLSDVMALLTFDASPLVDLVDENTSTFSGGTIVASPVIAGSSGALHFASGATGSADTFPGTVGNLSSREVETEGVTVECFVRTAGARGTTWVMEIDADFEDDDGNTLGLALEIRNGGVAGFIAGGDDPAIDHVGFDMHSNVLDFPATPVLFFPYSLADATYVHMALVVDVDTLRLYVAGTKVGEIVATVTLPGKITGMRFSDANASVSGAGGTFDRYFDSLRVSRGALYDADFTPPAAQFTYP